MASGSVQTLSGILTDSRQTILLGTFRSPRMVLRARVEVLEAFNSDGTDTIIIGHSDNDDAFVTSIDVSTAGVKSVTLGSGVAYDATPRDVTAKYTAGGSAPTQGAVHIILEWIPAPPQP